MHTLNKLHKEFVMRQGFDLSGKGQYQFALDKFRLAQDLDPRDAIPSLWMAFGLAELDRYAEAQAKFEQAISLRPDNLSLRAFLAVNYLDQNMVEQALETLTPLMSKSGLPKPVSDSYGLCLLTMGKIEEAYQALTLHSTHVGFRGVASRVFAACEEFLSTHISVATELDENVSEEIAGTFLVKVQSRMHYLLERIKFLLSNESRRATCRILTLAEQALEKRDYSGARQHVEDLLQRIPEDDLLLSAAEILLRVRDYAGVIRIADLINTQRNSKEFRALKILSLLRLDDLERADVLLKDSTRPEDTYLQGLLYLKKGLSHQGRKTFEPLLKRVNIDIGLDLAGIRLREVLRVHRLARE